MASEFQSSFIPKDSPTEEVFKKKKTGILGTLAVSLFVIAIILSIGLYIYKGILKSNIGALQSKLSAAEENVDKKTIREMSQFSKRLDAVKSIVFKHQVISNFIKSLASSTVSSVYFDDFSYNNLTANGLSVSLKGKATSYASVALQESIFAKNKYWKSTTFSNLTLADKGEVSFDILVSIDPKISVYSP